MAKQIKFTYNDKDYTLEYTRNSVKQMESEGFVASDIETKPMTVLPALFAGAFLAHHRFTKRDVIDEIYAKMTDKEKLITMLGTMYGETIEWLMKEPEEGNIDWTLSE